MSRNDSLGDRQKSYESADTHYLMSRTPIIIRLDGKAFHTWTKGIDGVFNEGMHEMMMQVTGYLCENIQNCVLGYTQSDEITLVLKDWATINTGTWFGNRQNKIESISGAMATAKFNELVGQYLPHKLGHLALFDARAFNVPRDEVTNNLIWRQQDATRNSMQMLGRTYFSHKQMHCKSASNIQDMLMDSHSVNWNDLDTWKKRGAIWVRELNDDSTLGSWIRDEDMPILTADREYVEKLLRYEDRVDNSDR